MVLQNNKKFFGLLVGLAVVITLGVAIFFVAGDKDNGDGQDAGQTDRVAFSRDTGINVTYAGESREQRVVFERYRFSDVLAGETVDITSENASVYVAGPDGEEKEIASDLYYYPFQIIPQVHEEGEYTIRAELDNGQTHEGSFQYNTPREVTFTPVGQTQELREGVEAKAFKMNDLTFQDNNDVLQIYPNNAVLSPPIANEYIWLGPRQLREGEHIFLAKVNGTWHYSIVNYPEDF